MPAPCFIPPNELPRAFSPPRARGLIKREPEDFRVEEILGFEPDGEGTHAWLQIRKRDANTQWLASTLARFASVRPVDVGYAGLKDRTAVTTQWFSVRLDGGQEPDWHALGMSNVEVLRVTRHRKKLRRGVLEGNRFSIRVRELGGDLEAIEARAEELRRHGVPNYFGAQRFGLDGQNVSRAWDLLCGGARVRDRRKRGLYLSAARALVFNRVLGHRVEDGSWQRALPGEVVMLNGTHSMFNVTQLDADIDERVARLDLHPTGPLWGEGESCASGEALAVEQAALATCREWQEGLQGAGLEQSRRALRVSVAELVLGFEERGMLNVAMVLPAGAYATMAVRELVSVRQQP